MTPISFLDGNEDSNLDRKPPVAPRKSPRNSCSDEEIGFLSKLTKFEMLSRQNRNCVSPKVFPAGGVTANVPAEQILSNSRSPSAASLPRSNSNWQTLQNFTNCDKSSRSTTPCHVNSEESLNVKLSKSRSTTPNSQHIGKYESSPVIYNSEEDEQRGNWVNGKNEFASVDVMSRSMIYQRPAVEHYSREFDMSQSLIVTKTTTTTEFLQMEKCASNPSVCNGQATSSATRENGEGSTASVRKIQPPSPAFNRNPKYNEHNKRCYGQRSLRVKSPTLSAASGCTLEEELRERQIDAEAKRREAENRRKQAMEERLREQEIERQEKMRLEEILTMCAEYERQSINERPRQPVRYNK